MLIQANPLGLIDGVACQLARQHPFEFVSFSHRASERSGNVVSVCPACPPAKSLAYLLHHANATMD
jgi:hypothetical protein